jgi:hypothetical protein
MGVKWSFTRGCSVRKSSTCRVSRQVIQDDMDLLVRRASRHNLLEEAHKLAAGVARCRLTNYLPGLGVERCVQ